MQDSISAPQMGGIVRMTGFILRATLAMELTGAVFWLFVFCGEMGGWKKDSGMHFSIRFRRFVMQVLI